MVGEQITGTGGTQEFWTQTSANMPTLYDQELGPVFFVDFATTSPDARRQRRRCTYWRSPPAPV